MRFKEFGSKEKETIVFIHGFGISWRMWMPQIEAFCHDYHVVVPVLNGHDEESDSTFISIEKSAEEIVDYIKRNCQGKVFAICGASLGATIAIHILAQNNNIIEKAIIDAGPVVSYNKALKDLSVWYRWVQIRLIARGGRVIKKMYLHTFFPKILVEDMFKVAANMSKETCKNANSSAFTYTMCNSIKTTKTEVVYWYGSKEAIFTKKSADCVVQMIPNAKQEIFKGYDHGELCIGNPDLYIKKAIEFFHS